MRNRDRLACAANLFCQRVPARRLSGTAVQTIELEQGAYVDFVPHWLADEEAQSAFEQLQGEVPWEERAIRVFGREVMQPRLVAWLGEPEAVYTYSGVRHVPLPFTPLLRALRDRLARELDLTLNGVLCNLYRDGRDSMGMHSDAEPELGPEPVVVSLSLGATRIFRLRPRAGSVGRGIDLPLSSGSLLVMRGSTQHRYRHGVPKQPSVRTPRINLTFRHVHGSAR